MFFLFFFFLFPVWNFTNHKQCTKYPVIYGVPCWLAANSLAIVARLLASMCSSHYEILNISLFIFLNLVVLNGQPNFITSLFSETPQNFTFQTFRGSKRLIRSSRAPQDPCISHLECKFESTSHGLGVLTPSV